MIVLRSLKNIQPGFYFFKRSLS